MRNVLDSCCSVFGVRMYLAQGIVPLLRIEDVKTAYAVSISGKKQSIKKYFVIKERMLVSKQQLAKDDFDTLLSHIAGHTAPYSSDVQLFTHNGAKHAGSAYLYPVVADASRSVSKRKRRSLLDPDTLFYKGRMLSKKMRFGTFLYYRGAISYRMLMQSIEWQKSQRPLLGQIAMRQGMLTPHRFAEVLMYTKSGFTFGEMAIRKRYLTGDMIRTIIAIQETYRCKIGSYFVKKRLITPVQLKFFLKEMEEHNEKFTA